MTPSTLNNKCMRFLDAIAGSRLGVTAYDYASWVQGVDDLGLFVGGEDGVDPTTEHIDACSYAYPPHVEKEIIFTTSEETDLELAEGILKRRDSKIEGEAVKHDQLESIAQESTQTLLDSLIINIETRESEEVKQTSSSPVRQRRIHLLKPSSLPCLSNQLTDSLHYALALLLTHCENIRMLNLQLPLPTPSESFPLSLPLLPNLQKLEISTRITDQTIQTILPLSQSPAPHQRQRLKHLLFTRIQVSDPILATHLISFIHPETLESLVLPSTPPSQNSSSYFFQYTTNSRRPRYNSTRDAQPQLTYPGILSILLQFRNLRVLDISAVGKAQTSNSNNNQPYGHNFDTDLPTQETNEILDALGSLAHLETLTVSLSRASGITVLQLSHVVLPKLKNTLKRLTLKATVGSDDYTGDSTVEE
ncbi:UNVERIFIED_CONTAM: hypothetical protein HDU68_007652 [Siphonaria sp. JEL0065]|nr:hypothetical protein HDU68_007652 [Siphonaria sp. JEL0065]